MTNGIDFIALDLETATWKKSSICEIGIAIVKDSKVVETKSWLVKPYRNWYDSFNISIHGITPYIQRISRLSRTCFEKYSHTLRAKLKLLR